MNHHHSMTNPGIDSRACDRLALACLAHLQQEEAALTQTLDRLYEIRKALLNRDQEALARAVAEPVADSAERDDLATARQQFRRLIAGLLGIPESTATPRILARYASPEIADPLNECRDRLVGLAREVETVHRANAMLVRQSSDLLDRMLGGLTGRGSSGSTQRYAADGRIQAGSRHSVIQEEC